MKTPFIHLMKTPMSNYAYDVNTNSFIKLSDKTYKYLEALISGDTDYENNSEEVMISIENLKSQGYLSSNRPKKIEHSQSQLMEYHLDKNIGHMTLQLTQECNFRCSYCTYGEKCSDSQRSHSPLKMSLNTALKAIDFFVSHSIDRNDVSIGFYGGEPLLKFDMIKTLINYAEKEFFGKSLTFNITTNGSLLTPEVARYLSKHNVNVTISLDGPPEVHDRSRVFANTGEGTYLSIKKNLDDISSELPEWFSRIAFNIVVDPRHPCNDLYVFFNEDETFKNSQTYSTFIDDFFSKEMIMQTEEFFRDHEYHRFKAYLTLINRYPLAKISKIVYKMVMDSYTRGYMSMKATTSLSEIMAPGGPCIPAARRLFVNANGTLYPCERVSETSDTMKIGNLNDGLNVEKARMQLNIGALTPKECKNCWALRHCQICVKTCDSNGKLSAKQKLNQCDGVKSSVEKNFKDYLLTEDFGFTLEELRKKG